MIRNQNQLEHDLCLAFQKEARVYEEALAHAQHLLAEWRPGMDPNQTLLRIAALMDQIAQLDAAAGDSRKQWQQSGGKPGPTLAAILHDLAGTIGLLRTTIGELERLAFARKNQLAPELDRIGRARQMQQAYGAAALHPRR